MHAGCCGWESGAWRDGGGAQPTVLSGEVTRGKGLQGGEGPAGEDVPGSGSSGFPGVQAAGCGRGHESWAACCRVLGRGEVAQNAGSV